MKICWIKTSKKLDGGNIYNQMVENALSDTHNQNKVYITNNISNKLLNRTKQYSDLYKLQGVADLWFRNLHSTITLPYDRTTGKNILICHHIDASVKPYRYLSKILEKFFYKALSSIDVIATISSYWKEHFLALGHENVKLIYCGFDLTQFNFEEESIVAFKETFRLTDKPIVYLGNCQKTKGVVEAYQELKDLDVYVVTSGKQRVDLPALNLELNYKDYLLLLKASSVVIAMSKFKEGWGITPHEAMLCKTPVVGSGLGGMRELLEGGKQVICDIDSLKSHVENILNDSGLSEEMGNNGYEYASKFTLDRFNNEWNELIRSLDIK